MNARSFIGVAVSVCLTGAGIANGIPFPTPTATSSDAITATPTPSVTAEEVIDNTPTPTAVPATGTATHTSAPSATMSPTQSPAPTPTTIASLATTVKSGKSNSSDRLFAYLSTASTTLTGPSDTRVVYQTPPSGDFILTQICVSSAAAGGILVSAAGLGAVAHLGGVARSCQSFDPGFILPPDSAVTCSTFASASPGAYFCMISGLLAPR